MKLHQTIENLLLEIADLPSAGSVVVFGSVAKQSDAPKDLDVALRAEDCPDWERAVGKHKETVNRLRQLSSQYYGWLDPFVVTAASLTARNDEATGWQCAKNAKAIKRAILEDGIPILELVSQLGLGQTRPSAEDRDHEANPGQPSLGM